MISCSPQRVLAQVTLAHYNLVPCASHSMKAEWVFQLALYRTQVTSQGLPVHQGT
jgi:hypothetical protein